VLGWAARLRLLWNIICPQFRRKSGSLHNHSSQPSHTNKNRFSLKL